MDSPGPPDDDYDDELHEIMLLQADPDQDPSSLRFAPGSLVMYMLNGFGWVEGEVLEVCMRLPMPRGVGIPDFPLTT